MTKINYSEEHINSLEMCLRGWQSQTPDTEDNESQNLYNAKKKQIIAELEEEIAFCKAQKKQPVSLEVKSN